MMLDLLICDHNDGHGLVRKLVEVKRQPMTNTYEELKQTLNVHADSCHYFVNVSKKVWEHASVSATFIVQAASEFLSIPAPKSQDNNGSQLYTRAEFEFNPAPDSCGLEHELKMTCMYIVVSWF